MLFLVVSRIHSCQLYKFYVWKGTNKLHHISIGNFETRKLTRSFFASSNTHFGRESCPIHRLVCLQGDKSWDSFQCISTLQGMYKDSNKTKYNSDVTWDTYVLIDLSIVLYRQRWWICWMEGNWVWLSIKSKVDLPAILLLHETLVGIEFAVWTANRIVNVEANLWTCWRRSWAFIAVLPIHHSQSFPRSKQIIKW